MYAVIETGGKQYRVQPGDFIEIEKQPGDVGSSLKLNQVLLVSKPGDSAQLWVGKPYLSNASVEAEVVGQGRGEKVLIIKMKRRKAYRRTQGHRQELTQILVTGLDNGSGEKAALSSEEKSAKLAKFQTSLTPKGGFPKVSKAEAKAAAKSSSKKSESDETSAPKKAASKKTTKKA